jgi:predicted hotdog family 3-hydroxylacyl-ACP dehydratase
MRAATFVVPIAAMSFPPLERFMPHRRPMLLLDALVAHEADAVVCIKTFTDADPFVENGVVSAFVTLELFAQAAAAHFGYLGLSRGGPMGTGALLGARKIELYADSFAVGAPLTVRAQQVMAMPPAAQFECTLESADGTRLAEGSISVAITA